MPSPDPGLKDDRLEFVRLENLERCFAALREHGASTVTDVASATGLSRPTVTDRLQDLVGLGLVVEVERVVRRGRSSGRPASRFALNPQAGFVIGAELGKHEERILVADVTGAIRARSVRPADHRLDSGARMESLVRHVADVCAAHADLGQLLGLGAAVAGSLSPEGIMMRSPIFAEWAGRDVAGVFRDAFDVPVDLRNDLNAAALAEHRHGAAADATDAVLALVWHQISAGIVINGTVHAGKRSLAGELSQLSSSAHTEMIQRWPSMPELLATVDAAEAGDAAAAAQVAEFARVAGEQIATMLVAIDPDVVVLYGPAAASDLVADLVAAAVHGAVKPSAEVPVVRAELGADAAATGVLIAALESATQRFFGAGAAPVSQLVDVRP